MKTKKNLLFLVFVLMAQSVWSISASINHAIYRDLNKDKTYIEIYTHIVGQSVVFALTDNNLDYQSLIQSTIIIKQGDKVIDYNKINLESNKTMTPIDFSDLTRMYLEPGTYEIQIELLDLNDSSNSFNETKSITVEDNHQISTLRLLSKADKSSQDLINVKNGVEMETLAYDRYFPNQNKLISYFELYPEQKTGDCYIKYSIRNEKATLLQKVKKYDSKQVIPCILSLNIEELPSDAYYFRTELVNKSQEVLAVREIAFTKSNPEMDMKISLGENQLYGNSFVQDIPKEDLDYCLKAIIPIASSLETRIVSNAIKNNEIKVKRFALYQFWNNSANGKNVKAKYEGYMNVARAIDKKYYSGFGYGFESDRGYIFLKYGKPTNNIEVHNEPSAPPYEIWVYDYIPDTRENNVRFLFYSPSLSDDYLLLHSTSKNEISNNSWEHELYKNAPKDREGNSIDGGTVKDNWNRKAKYYFNNI